ncbi:MAG: hypothetical protein ACXWT0_01745 [Methylobacter sp.]
MSAASEKYFKRGSSPTTAIKVEVSWEVKEMIVALSKKLGVRHVDLCGMWVAQINPDDDMLLEKIRHMKAKNEAERLSSTRNVLIAKLLGKGVMREIADMDNDDLQVMINKLKKRRGKK